MAGQSKSESTYDFTGKVYWVVSAKSSIYLLLLC
uniref:Uncharacterized protein n=1 Tax=Malus domestica TaxID=3750 RepID=E4Z8K8_MALDO|nr:hypothetical protein [Malus domestica]